MFSFHYKPTIEAMPMPFSLRIRTPRPFIRSLRRTIPLLAVLFLLLPSGLHAQTWHSIGTATAANGPEEFPTPFANYYVGQRMQSIYLASELTSAGFSAGDVISSIRWEVTDVQGCGLLNDYTIRLANTNLSTLSGFQVFPGGGVVTTPIDYTPTLGDNVLTGAVCARVRRPTSLGAERARSRYRAAIGRPNGFHQDRILGSVFGRSV